MANMGWNSKNNHYPHNDAQIACRFCSQVFPNREALIAHVDSHLARQEVINFNSHQTHPRASSRDQAFRSHQLAVMPNNLSIRTSSSSSLPSNLQRANRNVSGTRPLAPKVNRNVSQNRPRVPEVNRNGFDARSLMQKVSRNDFNALPLVQQGNNRINVANNHHQTFSWTSQPHPGPSSTTVTPPAPPPRRNPSLLTYVPASAPAGSLQPPQLGFSSATTKNSTRGAATRRRCQKRSIQEVAETTTEQTTRPFIDMLEKPIKKVDFIDLENMDEDGSEGSQKKKLDLALKL